MTELDINKLRSATEQVLINRVIRLEAQLTQFQMLVKELAEQIDKRLTLNEMDVNRLFQNQRGLIANLEEQYDITIPTTIERPN